MNAACDAVNGGCNDMVRVPVNAACHAVHGGRHDMVRVPEHAICRKYMQHEMLYTEGLRMDQ